jgi:hypothetical protein
MEQTISKSLLVDFKNVNSQMTHHPEKPRDVPIIARPKITRLQNLPYSLIDQKVSVVDELSSRFV